MFAAVIQPRGSEVVLELSNPNGQRLFRITGPAVIGGTERVYAIAEISGVYRLKIERDGAASTQRDPVHYRLFLETPHPQGTRERLLAQAFTDLCKGEDLRGQSTMKSRQDALAADHRSLRIWQQFGETGAQVETWARIGRIQEDLTALPRADEAYSRAQDISSNPAEKAELLILRGLIAERLGHPTGALDRLQEALVLARQAKSVISEARALAYSGSVSSNVSELGAAAAFYQQALVKWNEAGSLSGRLQTLQDLARLHLQLGEPARALNYLDDARQIDPDSTEMLQLLGMSFFVGQHHSFALPILSRALAQARTERDDALQMALLGDIGSVALRLGDVKQANAAFNECLRFSQQLKSLEYEAYARAGRGRVLGVQDRFDEAMVELDRADAMFRNLGQPASLALVLAGKALLERQRGDLLSALQLSRESMELIESQRQEVESPRARAALLGAWSDPYEIQIDVLWRLAQQEPGQGFEAKAFEASEKIRARGLYEGLVVQGGSLHTGAGGLERRHREVTYRLRALEREALPLSREAGEEARSRRGRIDAEIRDLLVEESALWEKIRRNDPRLALSRLQPLTLSRAQALLDSETAFLVYTLGQVRSFVWWIEKDSFIMRELPPRQQIEQAALNVQTLRANPRLDREARLSKQLNDLLGQLSEIVLAPVADELPRVRRLAIVPDGALQALPFAALPRPAATGGPAGEPLVASHVSVVLPSPSILDALRRREAERKAKPDKLIAVIADPVFRADDARLGRQSHRNDKGAGPDLPPLNQTKREAAEILRLVPPGMGRKISGFEAVPQVLTRDSDLRRYRYLHFGAHGYADLKHPEFSGIVLSNWTAEGRSRIGLLHFYDVYDLNLPVELVSLSTCRSAIGPQVRREGPITMTRSFFYAGASRVLGTLWDVKDKPAADLTVAFYEGVLRGGKRPAEALREAQDAMRSENQPLNHWAAFVLQGDWR